MKKLILLAVLAVGALTLSVASEAKADHWNSCNSGFGGGSFYSGYSYRPSYYSGGYAPVYGYRNVPVNSFGYAYPSTGFYYGRPGLSISIGSGYRGYSYGSFGGYRGYSRSSGHHHHH